jgi:Phage integrase family
MVTGFVVPLAVTVVEVGDHSLDHLQGWLRPLRRGLIASAFDRARVERDYPVRGCLAEDRPGEPVRLRRLPRRVLRRNVRVPGADERCLDLCQLQVAERWEDNPGKEARHELEGPRTVLPCFLLAVEPACDILALFPSVVRNPRGTKSFSAKAFAANFRTWVESLPKLLGPGGEPFDRSGITVYSFRHCYAQRHADAGTPVEVLADLMGHRQLSTTQVYYRVTQKRKRKAVDLLAALQVDRHGDRSRPTLERLLDSDQLRDAVGQVAVPFGICTEPTNVRAHGQCCPFRHQCFGCAHFRSDPSFLPELRAYLVRLLADRERLRAASPQLADWARKQAIPSTEEVSAVRRVVERCEALVGDLSGDERAQVEQAVEVLRRGRALLDTSVPVRFRGTISQASPTLFPNLERERRANDDH